MHTPHPFVMAAIAVGLAAPEALAQRAFDAAVTSAPTVVSQGITYTGQVNVIFQTEGGPIGALQTSFQNSATDENATQDHVMGAMNQAALAGLNEAVARGAHTGHADVIAMVYQAGIAGGAGLLRPLGVFINTTDMEVGSDGKAAFHTRVQFMPDESNAAFRAEFRTEARPEFREE